MDPYKFLRISRNADGSLSRLDSVPLSPPSHSDAFLCRDLPLHPATGTTLRLFLPLPPPSSPNKKLPVVLYFHGGGFILFRAASAIFHAQCTRLAAALPAVVLSVDYRLAPEHRLPAAYDDALDALRWLRSHAAAAGPPDLPVALRDLADFSRCFLMGNSAGANIVLHAALRAAEPLDPVRIAGLVFDQPYFGGVERSESEERVKDDKIIPLPANDLMWELALPEGADRDHEYCNPVANEDKLLARAGDLPRCLVRGHIGDPLFDRQREFARMLERRGVSVVTRMESHGCHGIEVLDPSKEAELIGDVRRFIYQEDGGGAAAAPTGWQRM